MEKFQKQFIILIEDLATEVSNSFKINLLEKNQLCTMTLYASIIENSLACAYLMNRSSISSMPILIRANYEALIDLKNSINDDEYYKRLHAKFLKENKKFLKRKVQIGNKKQGSKSEEFKKLENGYIQTKKELKKYEKAGYKPLSIKKKFKDCDSLEDYQTIYARFCFEIHNDLSVLVKKHIIYDDQGIPNVAIFKDRNKLDKEVFLTNSIGILRVATEEITEYLGIKEENKIVSLLNRFKKLQRSIRGDF